MAKDRTATDLELWEAGVRQRLERKAPPGWRGRLWFWWNWWTYDVVADADAPMTLRDEEWESRVW